MLLKTLYSLGRFGALPSLPFQRWKCHSSYLGERTHTPQVQMGRYPKERNKYF